MNSAPGLAVAALALTLAGCSAGGLPPPDDPAEAGPVARSDVALDDTVPVEEAPSSEPTVAYLALPEPCEVLSTQEIADAAGVGQFGPAEPAEPEPSHQSYVNAWGDYVNYVYCSLAFSDDARRELGIDVGDHRAGRMDLAIKVSTYNGYAYASGINDWSDTDPDGLLSSYFAANQERIGSNAIAEWVPDTNNRMVQSGSTVVASADDRYWVEVTMFMCHFSDCGPASLSIAQALVPRIAAS